MTIQAILARPWNASFSTFMSMNNSIPHKLLNTIITLQTVLISIERVTSPISLLPRNLKEVLFRRVPEMISDDGNSIWSRHAWDVNQQKNSRSSKTDFYIIAKQMPSNWSSNNTKRLGYRLSLKSFRNENIHTVAPKSLHNQYLQWRFQCQVTLAPLRTTNFLGQICETCMVKRNVYSPI